MKIRAGPTSRRLSKDCNSIWISSKLLNIRVYPLESSYKIAKSLVPRSLWNPKIQEPEDTESVVGLNDDDVPLDPVVGPIRPPGVVATLEISSKDPEHYGKLVS